MVFTTTAAPGLALAAHDSNATCHFYLDRVSEHAFAHCHQTLREVIFHEFLREERKKHHDVKVTPEDLNLVRIEAPETAIHFDEVGADAITPSWRSSANAFPSGEDFEKAVVDMQAEDCLLYNLRIAEDSGHISFNGIENAWGNPAP